MKKIISMLLVIVMCASLGGMLTACGDKDNHQHSYQTEWSKDATHHWHACEVEGCSEVSDKAEHTWNDGEITTPATADGDGVKTFICAICGQTKTEAVQYTEHQDAPVSTAMVYSFDDHNDLIVHCYDEKGRLSAIWDVSDLLLLENAFYSYTPVYSFTYGDDGRLTHFNDVAIGYGDNEEVFYAPSSSYVVTEQLLSISYHENGAIKDICERYLNSGRKLEKTHMFDANGRLIGILDKYYNQDSSVSEGHLIWTYEDNRVVMTMKEDGELYDADITLEMNGDGLPSKMSMRMGEQTSVTKEWTYDGQTLIGCSDYDREQTTALTYDDHGDLAKSETKKDGALIEYTLYTYDENGRLLTAKQYDAAGQCQTSDAYEYSTNGDVKTLTREEKYAGGDGTMVTVYTPNGKTETVTMSEWESYREYNQYGNTVLEVNTDYEPVNGVPQKHYTETTRYIYDVPEEKCYDYIKAVQKVYHVNPSENWLNTDIEMYSYYKIDDSYGWVGTQGNVHRQVDETTGSYLSENGVQKDYYRNWCNGENGPIVYYQKYCDSNGSIWYFTENGTKTPLT